MAEAVIRDKKRIIPSAVYCEGEYGVNGIFIGVPVKIGSDGVEEIIEIELNEDERAHFDASVKAVTAMVDETGL